MNEKICSRCKLSKELNEFYALPSGPLGRHSACKECTKKYESTEKRKFQYHKANLWTRYGLTVENYNNLLFEQKNKCKICGKHQSEIKSKLCVDHCHETGRVRGLLCFDCNTGLGKFLDSPTLLQNALNYVKD